MDSPLMSPFGIWFFNDTAHGVVQAEITMKDSGVVIEPTVD